VDHLHGGACAVTDPATVATLDGARPGVARGMATRLVRDRQVRAHEGVVVLHSSAVHAPV
jgi:hypothetical protein